MPGEPGLGRFPDSASSCSAVPRSGSSETAQALTRMVASTPMLRGKRKWEGSERRGLRWADIVAHTPSKANATQRGHDSDGLLWAHRKNRASGPGGCDVRDSSPAGRCDTATSRDKPRGCRTAAPARAVIVLTDNSTSRREWRVDGNGWRVAGSHRRYARYTSRDVRLRAGKSIEGSLRGTHRRHPHTRRPSAPRPLERLASRRGGFCRHGPVPAPAERLETHVRHPVFHDA